MASEATHGGTAPWTRARRSDTADPRHLRKPARGNFRSLLPFLNLAAILAILALDWITPAGVVVGILLGIPIGLTSVLDDPKQVWTASIVAAVGFVVAAFLGAGPISPARVWVPNRIFAFLTIPASCAVALLLQRRRMEAEGAASSAESARDQNRLLMSLLAHDLRAPLLLASQGFEYVERTVAGGEPIDRELLADTRARLQRSLRAIEIVLSVARPGDAGLGASRAGVRVKDEIEAEIASFSDEAAARGKTLVAKLDTLVGREYLLDGLVLRQALAILIDNAIRYAVPGPVRVEAAVTGSTLTVRVVDSGPGLSAHRAKSGSSGGSGLGLELSRSLAARARGSLEVEWDGDQGTSFLLRLPAA